MTYSLEFDARALKEWQKLGDTIRQQLKKKLAEILLNPRVEANRLRNFPDCYKVKLRASRYRPLSYQIPFRICSTRNAAANPECLYVRAAHGYRTVRSCAR